jgi:chemotaxis signal transduction protein
MIDWAAVRLELEKIESGLSDPANDPVRRRRILERRAELLGRREDGASDAVPGEALLVFRSGGTKYAFRMQDMLEAIRHPRISMVPGAPPSLSGLMQVRGDIVSVFSLAVLLGGSVSNPADAAGVVLLVQNQGRATGVLVESVEGTQTGRRASARPEGVAPPVLWRTEDLVSVLDPAQLIHKEQRT